MRILFLQCCRREWRSCFISGLLPVLPFYHWQFIPITFIALSICSRQEPNSEDIVTLSEQLVVLLKSITVHLLHKLAEEKRLWGGYLNDWQMAKSGCKSNILCAWIKVILCWSVVNIPQCLHFIKMSWYYIIKVETWIHFVLCHDIEVCLPFTSGPLLLNWFCNKNISWNAGLSHYQPSDCEKHYVL